MRVEKVTLSEKELQKLFGIGNGDAALLYIYLRSGNSIHTAAELGLNPNQLSLAEAMLRQMGLWEEEKKASFVPGERPAYSENDVISAMDSDGDFRSLYGEIQRLLGKHLNTEELKILLGFSRYLGLSNDVISVLVCYCKEAARNRGSLRAPSLRTIEKEAYAWAEQGIETLEQAAAYIRSRNLRNSRMEKLKQQLQIRGRNLTAGEEKYAQSWLDMGFADEVVAMAYERTCLNTGGLSWAYMNKILQRWHESGLHTAEEVRRGDKKPAVPKGASGQLGQAELEAIERLMREGNE
jgi:DnaD/phage-associated family protein